MEWAVAQSAKCLPHQHNSLNLICRTHRGGGRTERGGIHVIPGMARQKHIPGAHWLQKLQATERLSFKNRVWLARWLSEERYLLPSWWLP